ncbi:hypothetical protein PFISCL1PPCAC_5299, partial [Pristionchus fissidentatus]
LIRSIRALRVSIAPILAQHAPSAHRACEQIRPAMINRKITLFNQEVRGSEVEIIFMKIGFWKLRED